MPRWIVTGAAGALGSDLVDVLSRRGEDVVALDRTALDVTDHRAVTSTLEEHHAAIVVNAAAYTRVDDAEEDEAAATAVNGSAPGQLARWCAAAGARLIHVSTDYVFDGRTSAPYEVDAQTAPLSAYGRSKLAGERAVLAAGGDVHVVRSAWLYGARGPSFVRSVGRRLLTGETVDVVDDQRGAPTWTAALAEALVALGTADVPPGIWHCSAAGAATWYEVAVELAVALDREPALVRPTTSETFVRPARRPAYSVLSNARWAAAGLAPLGDWRQELREALAKTAAELVA